VYCTCDHDIMSTSKNQAFSSVLHKVLWPNTSFLQHVVVFTWGW